MGLIEFSKLPVNTLVGADWNTFKTVTKGQHIAPEKKTKFFLTKVICRILSTCVPFQERKYKKLLADKPMENDPLFILGHWRSGTTFVHNIFAQDKHFGYTTTYQTVFPHYVMALQGFFKPTMGWLMPDKRPTDNMELAPDLPQEEEFAINNSCPFNYYNFWFFPEKMNEYCDRYLTFKAITPKEEQAFKDNFEKLVKISLWNTNGTQYLSKNPPHTGRLKTMSELFPNAKYIFLMRNPYTVFESTRNFYTNTIKPLELHSIPLEQMEQNILRNYMELYRAYKEQKKYVPEGNIYEVKFEDIEQDALGITEKIYRDLNIPGWEEARPAIEKYIGGKKGYKKNKYNYDPRTVELVNQHWGEVLDEWGYERL
ncbi:MAG: sulfotransferase [Bacteroidaceae bacterium]|nr:sulfotransferase [Bacteroidaceae bacterium]